MCLDTVSKVKPKKSGVGWKAFGIHQNELRFTVNRYPAIVNKWLTADERGVKLTSNYSKPYKIGFHIFVTKKAAMEYLKPMDGNVRQVQYRKAHTMGRQYGYKVIVAKEIKILEPKKKNETR